MFAICVGDSRETGRLVLVWGGASCRAEASSITCLLCCLTACCHLMSVTHHYCR